MDMIMTRYEIAIAADKVDGYFLPKPGESHESAFLRAKDEAKKNILVVLKNIEALNFTQFRKEAL